MAELVKLGLPAQVIDRLEIVGLPKARWVLERQPRRADVLEELRSVRDALTDTKVQIERLLDATATAPARLAARRRIAGGGMRQIQGGLTLHQTSGALSASIEAVDAAISRVPRKAVRHQTASPVPVEVLFDEVQMGFISAGSEPVPKGFEPSSSPTSRFRRLVGVCYEAIDAKTTDPERAIKAFVREWRALVAQVRSIDPGTERPPKI